MDSNSSSPSFKRSLSPSEEKVNKKLARAVSMTKSPSPPAKRARKAATPQAAPQAGQDHKLVCLPKEAKHLKSSLQEQVATKSSEKLAKDLKRSLQEELATESSEKFAKECALLELQLKNLAKAGEVLDLKLEILKLLLEKAKSGDFTMAVVKEALN
ncbi:hypothetical protein FN846DRAFT_980628 [Sphaerosporella brunnea]|uniref:Uncharacterized protein n=1 Tax=Sphaerosporella brunnea TaxID=1250544 RepID=A0A5J5ECE3_9PEZI|nr:hypothetical protein FN846DRAFT_980628 [Sphaerosporella brunnea]